MKASAWLLVLGAAVPGAPEPDLRLSIEAPQGVLRPGRRMDLRFTLENASDHEIVVEEPESFGEGLQVEDAAGKVLRPAARSKGQPRKSHTLEPGAYFGRTMDIGPVFPDLAPEQEGWHRLRWSYAGSASRELTVWVMRDWIAKIRTNHGDIDLEFLPQVAPRHVERFLSLARSGVYDGSIFHRVIPGFMMQGGIPKDPDRTPPPLAAEFSAVKHIFGTVSMARAAGRDSATSQFFICFAAAPSLDGTFTAFGQVISGQEVVKEIERVKSDHDPCKKCGRPAPRGQNPCCGVHHEDRPIQDVVIEKVTVSERKNDR